MCALLSLKMSQAGAVKGLMGSFCCPSRDFLVLMGIFCSQLFPDASLVKASAPESRSATQVAPLEISDS